MRSNSPARRAAASCRLLTLSLLTCAGGYVGQARAQDAAPSIAQPATEAEPAEASPPIQIETTTTEDGAGGALAAPPAPTSTAPPPAAATTAVEAQEDAQARSDAEQRGSRGGLGIAVGTAGTGDLVVGAPEVPVRAMTGSKDEWEFQFHGFLRVPARLGIGTAATGANADDEDLPTKLHSPPQIPDGTFTDWQYTNTSNGPWTELRLSYGNAIVSANVQIAAYNVSDAGYRNLQAQLGINEAFITINADDLFGSRGGMAFTVGGFSNRYGAAGKYDAGKYDTYVIGRTHTAGETSTAFYDLTDDLTLTVEHGVGVKLEAPPLIAGLPDPLPPYLPYPGPEQQGTTLLHHLHAGVTYDRKLTLAAHYMTTWTDDARLASERDGRISTFGLEAKLDGGVYGEGMLAFSHVDSKDPLRVGPALEVLHSFGGWNLRDNYFGQETRGNGTIDTIAWQYTFSFATLMYYPSDFWGQAPDLLVSFFGMYNMVDGEDPEFVEAESKLKLGGEVTYTALGWLAVGARYDLVQPDLDDNTESFSVLGPKLILRSDFLAHEQVVLSWSHYFYGDDVRVAWPHAGLAPDDDVIQLSAIMWW